MQTGIETGMGTRMRTITLHIPKRVSGAAEPGARCLPKPRATGSTPVGATTSPADCPFRVAPVHAALVLVVVPLLIVRLGRVTRRYSEVLTGSGAARTPTHQGSSSASADRQNVTVVSARSRSNHPFWNRSPRGRLMRVTERSPAVSM